VKHISDNRMFLLRAPEGPQAVYVVFKRVSGQDAPRVRCGSGFGSAAGFSLWLGQKVVRLRSSRSPKPRRCRTPGRCCPGDQRLKLPQ